MSINPNPSLIFNSDFFDSGSSAADLITNDANFSLLIAGLGTGDSVAYEYSTDAGNSWIATTASQSNLADGSYQVRALVTYAPEYGFGGELSPSNWTVTIDGNGSIDISQAPSSISLFGADGLSQDTSPPEAGYRTDIAISSSVAWTASFNWNYSSDDFISYWDSFGYLINGNFYQLTLDNSDLIQSGSAVVSLNAGDVFGFRQGSVDAANGRASAQISGLVTAYSSVYSNVQSFTIDRTAAAAPSLALASDTGISSTDRITNDATINVTGLEAGASWEYSTNSGSNWTSGTGSSFELANGTYAAGSIIVRQRDIAGNTSANGQLGAVSIDTISAAPSLALANDTGVSATDRITNNGTINVTGLEAGASWQYSINSGSNWISGTGSSFVLASGNYGVGSILVRQSDIAGNTSDIGQLGSITLDTSAPSITAAITAVNDNVGLIQGNLAAGAFSDDTTPTISGTISAALASGETLRISNGATFLGLATVNNASRTWAFTPSTPLASGFYAASARVSDVVGNLGAASPVQRFSIDSTSNQIVGDANANTLTATAAKDAITGLGGSDTFRFTALSSSILTSFDRITDFAIGTDILDGPNAVSAASIGTLGAVSALDSTSISAVLTTSTFVANGAATFLYGDPSGLSRSFIALNDATAGYQSGSDALIEITGYAGLLNSLQII